MGGGEYELFISELVLEEIYDAPEPLRTHLLQAITDHEPETLEITDEVRRLTSKYEEQNLVPQKAYRDLVHLSVATVNNMNLLVSWNLSHIVKIRTKLGINAVNMIEGYRELQICTATEVLSC